MSRWSRRNAVMHLVSVVWRHSGGYRTMVIIYSMMAIAAVLVSLLAPLAMAEVIRAVEQLRGDELVGTAGYYTGLYVLVGICFWLLHGPSRVVETVTSLAIRRAFQVSLLRKVTHMPMSWHKRHHSGETIDQLAKASTSLAEFAETGFEVIHILVRFVGAVAFLTWLMPWAGVAVVVSAGVVGLVISMFDRVLVAQYAEFNAKLNNVAASIQDFLTNIGTVISLRVEDRVTREVEQRIEKLTPIWRKSSVTCELKWFSTSALVDLMHAGVLLGYIALSVRRAEHLEIARVFALGAYLRNIEESFFRFTGKYGDLLAKSTRVHAIDHIEAAFDAEVRSSAEAKLPDGWETIDVQGLTFSHHLGEGDGEHVATLRDLTFSLTRGRSIAFVGESGSGKSTLLKVLRGLYSARSATVLCDGVPLPHGMNHVAHHTTLIPQEPDIFSNTIRYNVSMGVEASDESILKALEQARFTPVLDRLSASRLKALETHVAEKGVSLSGGEKQRLAVARGIFFAHDSESEIVLLDEPTSSVDAHNERLIYETVLNEFRDKCVVTAIHKFHLLGLFDEIVVFANGRIVQRGSLRELISVEGEFSRLWQRFANGAPVLMTG